MAIKAHYLQNKDGAKFYPYAHADATYTKYGEKVGDVLEALEDEKMNKEDGKGLSANDYTDIEKNNLSTAYEHSKTAHARTDATKVEKSTTNGNIKINGNETAVYVHPSGTNPHGTTKNDIGLGNVNNTSDANKPVSTAQKTAIDKALTDAKTYTDAEIAELINGAPSTLDTLKEIADAMSENESVVESLNEAIGTKANQSALNSHTGNTTAHITATERTNWNDTNTKKHEHSNKSVLDGTTASYTTNEKTKLSGIATGAEVNQNAFSNVKVGETTITADSKTDTLTLVGSNVTITPDTTNDKVIIGITKDNVTSALGYTPPTAIPSVGNGTITITQNGTTKGTFTTNQSGNTTIALTDTNTNTDTKATQTNTTTNADYRVVLSTNANDTTETNTLRKSANFIANPSTGAFYAKGYDRTDITGQTLDINTFNLSAGSPEIMKYIEKTSGGAANIKNIPVSGQPFMLDVELIRWTSASDYITKQTFNSIGDKTHEYVRYCTSGTWDSSWTKRTFTDNNTVYTHPTSSGNKHIPSGGSSGQILRWSADGTAVWGNDNNTTYGVVSTTANGLAPKSDGSTTKFLRGDGTWAVPPDTNTTYSNFVKSGSGAKAGLVPAPSTTAGTTKYLREDGTWTVPPNTNTTYSNMTGATSSAAGKEGLVPAPAAGKQTSFLRGDGTWAVPPDTTYNNVTYTTPGLITPEDKIKLDGITTGADAVWFTRSLTSGTKVGTLTINGTDTDLYAPADTKNTAGSTNSSSKLFLVGATSQAANPQTYSHDTAYVGTDGCLYSGGKRCDTEVMSATEPTGQVTGDFWLQSY